MQGSGIASGSQVARTFQSSPPRDKTGAIIGGVVAVMLIVAVVIIVDVIVISAK